MSSNKPKISAKLIEEVTDAIRRVDYGSVEIIVQNKTVTQISVRNIKKTNVIVHSPANASSALKLKNKKERQFQTPRNPIYIGNKN